MANKFSLLVTIALAIVTSVCASPSRTIAIGQGFLAVNEFNPPPSIPGGSPVRRITNAERLSRGLPLNPPKIGRRAAAPSLTPVPKYSGIITIHGADDCLGYVDNRYSSSGALQSTTDVSRALNVEILYDGTPGVNAQYTDADLGPYTFLGGIHAFFNTTDTARDLAVGSANYAGLGGVTETPKDSPSLKLNNSATDVAGATFDVEVESSIWTLNPLTNAITFQWTNSDGSKTVPTVTVSTERFLALTGDLPLLASLIDQVNPDPVTLELSTTTDPRCDFET